MENILPKGYCRACYEEININHNQDLCAHCELTEVTHVFRFKVHGRLACLYVSATITTSGIQTQYQWHVYRTEITTSTWKQMLEEIKKLNS